MTQQELDLGITQKNEDNYEDSDYEVTYLTQLTPNETITGEIQITDIKTNHYEGNEITQFYIIITNHTNKQKWVCGITPSIYNNNGIISIYGKQGGRLYDFIDSLNHHTNGTELGKLKSYSLIFDKFQETVNTKIGEVTLKAIPAKNHNAKSVNIQITHAERL